MTVEVLGTLEQSFKSVQETRQELIPEAGEFCKLLKLFNIADSTIESQMISLVLNFVKTHHKDFLAGEPLRFYFFGKYQPVGYKGYRVKILAEELESKGFSVRCRIDDDITTLEHQIYLAKPDVNLVNIRSFKHSAEFRYVDAKSIMTA